MLSPPGPDEVWSLGAVDPLALLGVTVAGLLYATGRAATPPGRRPGRTRDAAMAAGLLAAAVAVASPLDAMAQALLSAHMVQHVLLVSVAAPLLAVARPGHVMRRGLTPAARRLVARGRGGLVPSPRRLRQAWRPATAGVALVAVLWLWHGAAAYQAALAHPAVHLLEHATMLGAALLFWGVVVGATGAARTDRAAVLLLVFAVTIPTGFLSALMTFAPSAWYPAYTAGAAAWGVDPLTDQHLAGVLMWIPMGAVHTVAVLILLARWFAEVDSEPLVLRSGTAR